MNLLNTCSVFQNILSKRSPTFLFPKAFPDLCKHLEGGEILRCREVCKAWNYGVDHFLEEHKSLRPHDDENCDPRDPPFVSPMEMKRLYTPSFVAKNSIRRYGGTYPREKRAAITIPDPNRNPFIGRAIEINSDWGETALELYGQHIWYLTVNTGWESECAPECCFGTFEMVYQVLTNLPPNLRKLRINNARDDPFDEGWYSHPSLDNLETLHFDTSPQGIHRSLSARYHLQLRRVHMRAVHWSTVYNLGWPALVELHLQDISTKEDHHYDSLLRAEMPNLQKLGCGSKAKYCDSKDMLDRMLKIITNLSEITRLNTVRFNAHISMGWSKDSIEELRDYAPPSLKTLEMEHFCSSSKNDLTDYSILLHFPFLENINVYWREVVKKSEDRSCGLEGTPPDSSDESECSSVADSSNESEYSSISDSSDSEDDYLLTYQERKKKEMIKKRKPRISDSELVQVNRYIIHKELYKSNIWELLPRLKVLTLQMDLYTREGYDNFMKWKKGSNVP